MLEQKELRRHIKTLERRLAFLGQRIADHKGKTIAKDAAYDRAEFNALKVAIEQMESLVGHLPSDEGQGQIKAVHR